MKEENTRTIRRHGGKIRWQHADARATKRRCVIMIEGKSRRISVRLARVLLFTRSLSVTMCSLGRVNILLSSARPRTIKLYASAR